MSARTATTPGPTVPAVVLAAAAVLTVVAGIGIAVLVPATPAAAQCAPRLSVSRTANLAAGGETITVSGTCYDVSKGVYVAFCVVPPAGTAPSPCGGGVDLAGANGLSHWISSNPPPYGVGVAVPYGAGGSFTVTMRPSAALNPTVDCRRVSCAIVTRNDHTRSSDRGQDVIVPVTFAAAPTPTTAAPVAPAPPPTVPPTTAAPETTTTAAADTTTTTVPAEVAAEGLSAPEADEVSEELAADTVADESAGGGSSGPLVAAVVLVVLAAGIGGGWFALRHRTTGGSGSGS